MASNGGKLSVNAVTVKTEAKCFDIYRQHFGHFEGSQLGRRFQAVLGGGVFSGRWPRKTVAETNSWLMPEDSIFPLIAKNIGSSFINTHVPTYLPIARYEGLLYPFPPPPSQISSFLPLNSFRFRGFGILPKTSMEKLRGCLLENYVTTLLSFISTPEPHFCRGKTSQAIEILMETNYEARFLYQDSIHKDWGDLGSSMLGHSKNLVLGC